MALGLPLVRWLHLLQDQHLHPLLPPPGLHQASAKQVTTIYLSFLYIDVRTLIKSKDF